MHGKHAALGKLDFLAGALAGTLFVVVLHKR